MKIGLLALVGLGLYLPAWRGDWIWDDALEVAENAVIQGPAKGLLGAWLAPTQTDYFPLKTTVQWVEWHLWGDSRLGYHLVSIGLHLLSACLLWRLLSRLGVAKAWWGGVLFLVHPLAVESVAWISELKNTLSLPLLLLAMLSYLDFDEDRPAFARRTRASAGRPGRSDRRRFLLFSLASFVAAMLAKASVVMFPACLLLYAWWRRGRIARRDLLASLPFFVVSAILGVVAVVLQTHRAIGAGHLALGGWGLRTAAAGTRLLFYLGKFFWPFPLLPLYARRPLGAPDLELLWPWLILALLAAWFWRSRESFGRTALFGLGWFVLNLFPVLGIIPMAFLEYAWVADHFAYVAMLGLVGLMVAASGVAADWLESRSPAWARAGAAVGVAALLALAGASYRQASYYREALTFWSRAVRENPGAWAAHYNLAEALIHQPGREADAWEQYEATLRLKPDYAEGHYSVALLLAAQPGREEDAIAQLETALRLKPDFVAAHNNLANLLSHRPGRQAEAESHYEAALRLRPDFAEAQSNLALLLGGEPGREVDALAHAEAALRLRPEAAEAHENLAVLLSRWPGRQDEAQAHYETALQLQPDDAAAHYNFALLLAGRPGRETEAEAQYEAALRLGPGNADAHNNLAILLARLPGRQAEAIGHFEAALRLRPEAAFIHFNLALVLERSPGGRDEAARQLAAALSLDPGNLPAKEELERLRVGGR